jgi:NEDD8-activating enzyme E1 regulatory subunit
MRAVWASRDRSAARSFSRSLTQRCKETGTQRRRYAFSKAGNLANTYLAIQETLDLPKFLCESSTYTLIMYTMPVKPKDLEAIQAYGQQHQTPLFAIHTAGFYSYFRISLPGAFPIVDTHPEIEKTVDLRLTQPWPELSQFAQELTQNIDTLDDHAHGHLPYVVLLLHYLEKWRAEHNGEYPLEYKTKVEFRKSVAAAARTNTAEGGEENFDEAVAAVNRNVKKHQLESTLKEVFDHKVSSEVWILPKKLTG